MPRHVLLFSISLVVSAAPWAVSLNLDDPSLETEVEDKDPREKNKLVTNAKTNAAAKSFISFLWSVATPSHSSLVLSSSWTHPSHRRRCRCDCRRDCYKNSRSCWCNWRCKEVGGRKTNPQDYYDDFPTNCLPSVEPSKSGRSTNYEWNLQEKKRGMVVFSWQRDAKRWPWMRNSGLLY